jgi:predicted MFS family arabinose efflux permease
VALGALGLFVRRENGGGRRLLPRGACRPATGLGATYAAMMLVVIAINTEIFVPYFLQTVHGMAPVNAGYLSALMSMGWTLGAVGVAGASARAVPRWMRGGPLAIALALAGMFVLMPRAGLFGGEVAVLGACLLAQGCGIGMCWPHVCAGVFRFAPAGESDLAAASMTMVIMVSNALGSALAGMVANAAGLSDGGVAGAQAAASGLFGCYLAAPVLAFVAVGRILALRRG